MKKRLSHSKIVVVDEFKHAKKGIRKQIQKFGSFMAGMIMPVVAILIAWGLIAALFLTKYDAQNNYQQSLGWVKDEFVGNSLGRIVAPTMKYLIPVLIAFIAGKMVYDTRGAMIGSFTVMLAIVGNDWLYRSDVMGDILYFNSQTATTTGAPNQIIAAFVLAPLSAYLFKRLEKLYLPKIKPGFEMVVKNFGLALASLVTGIIAFFGWGFIMYGVTFVMIQVINVFNKANWAFPFLAIFTEPLRAMFLNNALNHGVMVPLGTQDLLTNNKIASWYFMVGGNPGPGFGLLMAYFVWRKQQRAAAGSASVIQLFGGIHEVHYVYILAEPIMVLSTIAGAMSSLAVVAIFNGGTSAVISPGSMISVIAMSPGSHYLWVNIVAVLMGSAVSFLVASFIMIFKKQAKTQTQVLNVSDTGVQIVPTNNQSLMPPTFSWSKVKLIMVACDAGMGSSALGASIIKKFVKDHHLKVDVQNTAVKDLTSEPDIIVTLSTFSTLAREHNSTAYIYEISKFLGSEVYKKLFDQLEQNLVK